MGGDGRGGGGGAQRPFFVLNQPKRAGACSLAGCGRVSRPKHISFEKDALRQCANPILFDLAFIQNHNT